MIPRNHVLVCTANSRAGIPAGLALGRALMEAHFVAAGHFAINLPDAELAPEKGVGWAAAPKAGLRLQIFGAEQDLHSIRNTLATIGEIVDVGRVYEIRNPVRHMSCRRHKNAVRTRATIAREIRRAERKAAEKGGSISAQLRRNLQASQCSSRLPYLSLVSLSTGQAFSVRFETKIMETAADGEFNSYGFSKAGATVPLV